MDFAAFGAGGAGAGLTSSASLIGSEGGPILYSEPNRTSAIDDIRSVVLYIFIVTIFLSFFLILPGIRNEKFPTFLCITTSLIVTSIILISLFGTTWHVAEAPISAAYKAFSRDRIQGKLSVKIGLHSVNITLRAHKYFILDAINGPILMDSSPFIDGGSITSHLTSSSITPRSISKTDNKTLSQIQDGQAKKHLANKFDTQHKANDNFDHLNDNLRLTSDVTTTGQKYTIKRVNVDINYNERFYWIGPNQMRQEYHNALERGLPYPILTVVEYLSQDDAGFNWSRQYRSAGYYTYICLWLSLCVCILMFFLHCAAPKYGIYTMQFLGCILLFTNFTYAVIVPRGDQKLVIPFEGHSLSFEFGWNFWIVLIGGCLSLVVGTIIVLIDSLFPNFIFTTVLDVDFDYHHNYYKRRRKNNLITRSIQSDGLERPTRPPFYQDDHRSVQSASLPSNEGSRSSRSSSIISSQINTSDTNHQFKENAIAGERFPNASESLRVRHTANRNGRPSDSYRDHQEHDNCNGRVGVNELNRTKESKFNKLFANSSILRPPAPTNMRLDDSFYKTSDSEDNRFSNNHRTRIIPIEQHERHSNLSPSSSVVDIPESMMSDNTGGSNESLARKHYRDSCSSNSLRNPQQREQQHHYSRGQVNKNPNLKNTHHQSQRKRSTTDDNVRL